MNFAGKFADRIMPEMVHQLSLSFLIDELRTEIGGTATNIAYSLNLLGHKPQIVSAIGNDGADILEFLESHHISTTHILQTPNHKTGAYFVITDTDNNQIGSFYTGATQRAAETSIPKDTDFAVLAPTLPEAMNKYVKECQKHKIPYLYDPAFQIDHFSAKELLTAIKGAAILIGNDYEISLIKQKIAKSHTELLKLVPILITTLGSEGSKIETATKQHIIPPAKPKNTTDPTGAGDAFRAGFLAGYLRGFDLEICGMMGSVSSVYTVEKYGTVTHSYTISDFKKRFQENFNKKLPL